MYGIAWRRMGEKELVNAFQVALVQAENVLDTQFLFELAEPHYRKCLSIIEQAPEYRGEFEALLLKMYVKRLISDEPLAYLMHILRWKNIKRTLENELFNDPVAIATGRGHEKVLAAYDDKWLNKDFYKFSD